MALNTVQSIGSFNMTISHPQIEGGIPIVVTGIKLEGTFISVAQDVDNSKRVAFIDGSTFALTNTITMGKVTVNTSRTNAGVKEGNLIAFCDQLKTVQDSTGCSIVCTLSVGSGTTSVTTKYSFDAATLVTAPPLIIAGNDLPDYPCVFSFGSYTVG